MCTNRHYRITTITAEGRKTIAVHADREWAERFISILRIEQATREYPKQFELEKTS